jgi:hypothetical protein
VVITITSPSQLIYPEETVNVQAMKSNFGNGTSLNSTITWNFGDPSSPYNVLNGFSAAHAYAQSGTYTITLSITTPDGHVGVAKQTVTIAVDNRPTIYVSQNGSDNNDGSSPSQAIQSIDHLNSIITSNERVLFQAGGTYNMSNDGIDLSGTSHVYLGSYGSGAKPLFMYTGPQQNMAMVYIGTDTTSAVIQGFTFDSIYVHDQYQDTLPTGVVPQGSGTSILDNTFMNLTDDVSMNQVPTNVLVQGNTSPDAQALNAYFVWLKGTNIAVIGNTVANSVGETILRMGGETDNTNILVADNNFTNIAGAGGYSGDIAKATIAVQGGHDIYIYHNTLHTGVAGEGPLGTDTGSNPDATVTYTVFDSNILDNGSAFVINPGDDQTMFKNNVVFSTGNTYAFGINSTEFDTVFNLIVQDLYIVHNTVIDSSENGGMVYLFDGESVNVTVDNNLFVGTNLTIGGGNAYIYDTNDDLNSFKEIKNNVWGSPGQIYSWTQGGLFFVGSDPNNRAAWLTPAEWDALGVASGDTYETVVLGSTYSVDPGGFTAGSNLPNS